MPDTSSDRKPLVRVACALALDSIEVDYGHWSSPFCSSLKDEINFCACGGNLGMEDCMWIFEQ